MVAVTFMQFVFNGIREGDSRMKWSGMLIGKFEFNPHLLRRPLTIPVTLGKCGKGQLFKPNNIEFASNAERERDLRDNIKP